MIKMKNSEYTYDQVLAGDGSYSEADNTGYSEGVKIVQERLCAVGYEVPANGLFESTTTLAVKAFQQEQGLAQSGVVDQSVLIRLTEADSSEYFLYGAPLSESQWNRDLILAGSFNDVDLLSRIIYAENTRNSADQSGVAVVIKNRSENASYHASAVRYPNASIWARVVGMANQYSTATSGSVNARQPSRGTVDNVAPGWKSAVNLAKRLVSGTTMSAPGYIVENRTVTTRRTLVSTLVAKDKNYLNQIAWAQYLTWLSNGLIDSVVEPVVFTPQGTDSNVICKRK